MDSVRYRLTRRNNLSPYFLAFRTSHTAHRLRAVREAKQLAHEPLRALRNLVAQVAVDLVEHGVVEVAS